MIQDRVKCIYRSTCKSMCLCNVVVCVCVHKWGSTCVFLCVWMYIHAFPGAVSAAQKPISLWWPALLHCNALLESPTALQRLVQPCNSYFHIFSTQLHCVLQVWSRQMNFKLNSLTLDHMIKMHFAENMVFDPSGYKCAGWQCLYTRSIVSNQSEK